MRNDFGDWRGEYFELNAPEWLLSDNAFLRLSSLNKGVRMERTADGRLIAMPPVSVRVSMLNVHLTARLGQWDEATGLGIGFASSIGFHLPNGAVLSPDLSWVSQARWDALSKRAGAISSTCPGLCGGDRRSAASFGRASSKDARMD